MTPFLFFVAKTTAYRILVVVITVIFSLVLFGSTLEQVLTDRIEVEVVEGSAQDEIQFTTSSQRQAYIDEQIELRKKNLGLDEPWYSPKRFINTIAQVMILNLGRSYFSTSDSGSPEVLNIIGERVPRTLLLFSSATIITFFAGLYLGPYLAVRYRRRIDKGNVFVSMFSSSLPGFWVGMIMIYIFASIFPIFPGRSTPSSSPMDPFYIFDLLYHMALPLITLIALGISVQSYFVRLFVVDILDEDFIKAKQAMGIPRKKILYSHAIRNAAPPLLNSIILGLASSFGGALLVEIVFDWPGMGSLLYRALTTFDTPIIIGVVYISTLIYIVAVFATDLAYSFFDPRVKAIS